MENEERKRGKKKEVFHKYGLGRSNLVKTGLSLLTSASSELSIHRIPTCHLKKEPIAHTKPHNKVMDLRSN